MSRALILIDVQNAFYDGVHMPPLPQADRLIETILNLLARARVAGAPVIFLRHNEVGSEFDPGSLSWELLCDLAPRPDEMIIDKTRPDGFFETDLETALKDKSVTELVVAGNQTDYCVNATSRAARERGFRVILASDAHGTWDSNDRSAQDIIAGHNRDLGAGIAEVMPSELIRF